MTTKSWMLLVRSHGCFLGCLTVLRILIQRRTWQRIRKFFFACVGSNHHASQEGKLLFHTCLLDLFLKLCDIDSYSPNKYPFVQCD